MPVEAKEGMPKFTEAKEPKFFRNSIIDTPDTGGIRVQRNSPRVGETMAQVFIGPSLREVESGIRVVVHEPFHPHDSIEKGSLQLEGIAYPPGYQPEAQTAAFPDVDLSEFGGPTDEEITNQVWDKYFRQPDAKLHIFGTIDPKKAFDRNAVTIEAMAHGEIPTPPEFETVVAAFLEDKKAGKEEFNKLYEKMVS